MKKFIFIGLLMIIVGCSAQQEMEQSEDPTAYQEKHRLQFHFSPQEKWMNDPNGMVFYDGEYHLFYQYYPDSTIWGPMHWGHAVSEDLVHWEHLPVALYPDSLGYIFSGSAVFDRHNTSGLGTTDNPPLVAIYTYHKMEEEKAGAIDYQTQAIAYSTDKGRTWTKYEGNPVIKNPGIRDFRDPKVFWMENQDKWIMALAVKDHISFYSSPDLISWSLESDFGQDLGAHGGVWECPDLFPIDDKWVLLVSINPGGPNGGSATQYFVGDFDGKTFVPQDDSTRWLDYGRDNYAGVTWSNISKEDNRKLFIGWMSNWDYGQVVPTEPWRSAMTIPRSLALGNAESGYYVKSFPAREVEQLHQNLLEIKTSDAKNIPLNQSELTTYDLELELNADEFQPFDIEFFNDQGDTLKLGYAENYFYINRDRTGNTEFSGKFTGIQTAPFSPQGNNLNLRILLDVGSLEVFVNDGELVMTSLFFPQEPLNKAQFINSSKKAIEVNGKINEMKRIWE